MSLNDFEPPMKEEKKTFFSPWETCGLIQKIIRFKFIPMSLLSRLVWIPSDELRRQERIH